MSLRGERNRKSLDPARRSCGGMRVLTLAAALLAAPLSGCSASVDAGNFVLTPTRIGWNVTDVASFLLEIAPSRGLDRPEYTIDPVFAVQSLELDTGGIGGDYATQRPEELGFELVAGNRTVGEHRLVPGDPVTLRFRLPEDLKDDAYALEIVLFQAGEVKSGTFRVNRP